MKRAIISCFLFLQCLACFGQLHFDKVSFKSPDTYKSYLDPFNIPSLNFSEQPLHITRYELPKGAIFCRVEDALYKRFNIWIKFRMGTDDKFSN